MKYIASMKPDLPYRRRAAKKGGAVPREAWKTRALLLWGPITGTLALLGWLLTSGPEAWDTARDAWRWVVHDHRYSGRWTNDSEGHVDRPSWGARDGEVVIMSLEVTGSEAVGEIHGDRLCGFAPWHVVMIEGERRWWWGPLRLRAFDYIRGEKTLLGAFEAKVNGEGMLELVSLIDAPTFPARVELFKESVAGNVSDLTERSCSQGRSPLAPS